MNKSATTGLQSLYRNFIGQNSAEDGSMPKVEMISQLDAASPYGTQKESCILS